MSLINIAKAGVISDAPRLSDIGLNILSFLLSLVGILAIIALVVAGLMYFTSFDDKKKMEEAKTYVKVSIIGIIMALSGMVLARAIAQFFAAQ